MISASWLRFGPPKIFAFLCLAEIQRCRSHRVSCRCKPPSCGKALRPEDGIRSVKFAWVTAIPPATVSSFTSGGSGKEAEKVQPGASNGTDAKVR